MSYVFGFMQDVPFMGGVFPDIYMGSEAGSDFKYVRRPLPTDPPTTPETEPEPEASSSVVTTVVIAVVVGLVVIGVAIGIVFYAKMAKSKSRRSGSVTPSKPLVDEEWSRVTPSPTEKKNEEFIRHF